MTDSAQTQRRRGYLDWPNRISLLRLLLVAPFVLLIQHQREHWACRYAALGIFAVMAVSDAADGFLARRLDRKTRLGAILDPLADKTLIICAAVLLSLPHSAVPGAMLPDWVVVMIVGKDLWVILGFMVVFLITGKVRVHPTRTGKLCTVGQLALVAAVLLSPDLDRLGHAISFYLTRALWWAAAGLSALAVVSYTRLGARFVAEADHAPPNHPHGKTV